jgi:hypothetical protein
MGVTSSTAVRGFPVEAKKRCNRCGEMRPLETYQRNPTAPDGRRTVCKLCLGENAPPKVDPVESARRAHELSTARNRLHYANEQLLKENDSLKKRLEQIEKSIAPARVELIRKSSTTKDEEAVACCVASDWHVEEPVAPESVNGLNEYSPAIAEKRSQAYFRNGLRLTNMMAKETMVKTIWLGLLGDFFTNYLHDENRELNELPPAEAAQFAQSLLASGISHWLKESPYRLVIDCVAGNHGRMTVKPRNANHSGTSLETFMYYALAKHFEGNPRVEFRVAQSKMLYRRFFTNFQMRLIHGDDIGYQGGIGGVTIPIRKKIAAWDKSIRADLTVLGHFHQMLNGGDHIVNGSLMGFNAYAQGIGASPEEPRQQFFLVHARGGGQVSVTAPIWLEDMRGHA